MAGLVRSARKSGALPALPRTEIERGALTALGCPFLVVPTARLTGRHRRSNDCGVIDDTTLARLEATIASRRGADPASSYVAKLNARGLPEIARKLGEEATEAVVAALSGSREELVGEAADVLFHLMVLLGAKGVPLAEVLAELDRREGTSGIEEKAARGSLGKA